MMLALIFLQAAQPAPAGQQPDIQLDIRATARRVVIDNRGQADLTVRTSVNGREGEAGNLVDVDAPQLPSGQRELRNVSVRVRAETRVAAPGAPASRAEEPASPR